MDEYAKEKRREQNLIVRSGKSEAEVTNTKRQRSRYSTAKANYRQTRSIVSACLRQQSYLFHLVTMILIMLFLIATPVGGSFRLWFGPWLRGSVCPSVGYTVTSVHIINFARKTRFLALVSIVF